MHIKYILKIFKLNLNFFLKKYEDLNIFIKDNFKKIKIIVNLYCCIKNMLISNYLSERKSRMLKNFEVDLLGLNF